MPAFVLTFFPASTNDIVTHWNRPLNFYPQFIPNLFQSAKNEKGIIFIYE